jgi:DNA replication protein DnaC
MINDQVRDLSHQLRLTGIHAHFEKRAQEVRAGSLDPVEYLRLLLEDEMLARKDRLAKSLTTRAKFRTIADIEDWDQTFDRGITKAKLRELASLAFYQSKENLLILGKTGEGKTHLAISLGRKLCRDNLSVFFLPVNFLFEEVIAARTSGKYLPYIRRLTTAKVLVFDDFGLRNYTHEEANVLVDILEDRHQKGPVIVTSQVDPRSWVKLFEDPVIAEAITDRLLNPSQRILLKGGSYREKLQKPLIAGKGVEK